MMEKEELNKLLYIAITRVEQSVEAAQMLVNQHTDLLGVIKELKDGLEKRDERIEELKESVRNYHENNKKLKLQLRKYIKMN